MQKIFYLMALSFILLFSACAAYNGGSYIAPDLPANKAQLIVNNVVERLQAVYPPGYTALKLDIIDYDYDFFGAALEKQLRAKGFSIEDSDAALTLTYTVDSIVESQGRLLWYAHIRISDGFSFAQVYELSASPQALGGITQITPQEK